MDRLKTVDELYEGLRALIPNLPETGVVGVTLNLRAKHLPLMRVSQHVLDANGRPSSTPDGAPRIASRTFRIVPIDEPGK